MKKLEKDKEFSQIVKKQNATIVKAFCIPILKTGKIEIGDKKKKYKVCFTVEEIK